MLERAALGLASRLPLSAGHAGRYLDKRGAMTPDSQILSKTSSSGRHRAVERPRVLLVDDERLLRAAFARNLRLSGFDVATASDGGEALRVFRARPFDVVVSDLSMPGLDGVQLLRAIRQIDPDVPFILVTGGVTIDSALHAVELGALRYLRKPVACDELETAVRAGLQLRRMAHIKRQAVALLGGHDQLLDDRSALEETFEKALPMLTMAYQPIVSASSGTVLGYEALLRSSHPVLSSPCAVLDAAERLGRVAIVGRCVRRLVAADATLDPKATLFVNLHPLDLMDDDLFDVEAPLSAIAHRVVLEITERASLGGVRDIRARLTALRALGFRIALDDLGSGYAGLTSFATLEPEVVKVDMALVRGCDASPTKQKLIVAMLSLARDMRMLLVAEGVETIAERDTLVRLGCDAVQGFFFARPAPAFPVIRL
jgi:EAL domain-containing protein (putative c-di-GMP-specific phosphodiesterase class I)